MPVKVISDRNCHDTAQALAVRRSHMLSEVMAVRMSCAPRAAAAQPGSTCVPQGVSTTDELAARRAATARRARLLQSAATRECRRGAPRGPRTAGSRPSRAWQLQFAQAARRAPQWHGRACCARPLRHARQPVHTPCWRAVVLSGAVFHPREQHLAQRSRAGAVPGHGARGVA
jgi:hypothetical protein